MFPLGPKRNKIVSKCKTIKGQHGCPAVKPHFLASNHWTGGSDSSITRYAGKISRLPVTIGRDSEVFDLNAEKSQLTRPPRNRKREDTK